MAMSKLQMKEMEEEETERIYQTKLIGLAKQRNIIVCLPTGSGKTFISLQLAKHYLQYGKFIVFITNSVQLVKQQATYFRQHIPPELAKVAVLTGDGNFNRMWESADMNGASILFLTSKILLDALNHARIRLDSISLCILDECHHADKESPMSEIMRLYGKIYHSKTGDRTSLPRILGLTATIIRGMPRSNEIMDTIEDIEKRLCCKAVTYGQYDEVLKYSTQAQNNIQIKEYSLTRDITWNGKHLKSPLKAAYSFLKSTKKAFPRIEKKVQLAHPQFRHNGQIHTNKSRFLANESINILTEILEVFTDMGPYIARIAAQLKLEYLTGRAINMNNNEDLLLAYTHTAISRFIAGIDALFAPYSPQEQVSRFVTQKIRVLKAVLAEYRCKELSGIVFTQKRISAQILNTYFLALCKACGHDYCFLRPDVIVGTNRIKRDPIGIRASASKTTEKMEKFRTGKTNVLFSTSVLEEGLDVPSCNIVIRFDSIASYPSFVQSMGRARKRGASFVVLRNEAEDMKKGSLGKFLSYNQKLSDSLVDHSMSLKGGDGDQDEVDGGFDSAAYEKYIFDPGNNIPRITANSAVEIINRYCTILDSKRRNNVKIPPVCFWADNKATIKFKTFIQMPYDSHLPEFISGPWMESKKLAKKVAQLEVCKMLHGKGLLDENLIPRKGDAFQVSGSCSGHIKKFDSKDLVKKISGLSLNSNEKGPEFAQNDCVAYNMGQEPSTSAKPMTNHEIIRDIVSNFFKCGK